MNGKELTQLEDTQNKIYMIRGAQVSRIISAALETGLIKKISVSESRRDSAYIPFWSSSREIGT